MNHTKKICFTALFTAMNVILSMEILSVPTPGGHLYLNDVIIVFASLLLEPYYAFVVGGVGSFLGDLLFYPAPMFVSLVTHGLQAVVVSLIAGAKNPTKIQRAVLAVAAGAIIMVAGYSLGRAYIYSNKETALIKLPFQWLQAGIGACVGTVLYYSLGRVLSKFFVFEKKEKSGE